MSNTASLKNIKSELSTLTNKELMDVITSVIKFRKENKELVTYLLFDSKDEAEFIKNTKAEIDTAMSPVNKFNVNTSMKYIRKVLRNTRKVIKFSGNNETEVQLLIHFCSVIKGKNLPINRVKALVRIWDRCILNIQKAISMLHEDLRYDYGVELNQLNEENRSS